MRPACIFVFVLLSCAIVTAQTSEAASCSAGGMMVAGSSCYPTIQRAISAAEALSPKGSVVIPGTYSGTDAYTNPGNAISMLDLRNGSLGIWHILQPSGPVIDAKSRLLPLGHDLLMQARGPADVHLAVVPADTAAATTISASGTLPITVGSTADLYTGASITIEPSGANEETILPEHWSIVNSTTLSATFAKTHTQPYIVRQIGAIFLDAGLIKFMGDGKSSYVDLWDSKNNRVVQFPSSTANAFPDSAWKFNAIVTGMSGANKNLVFRNNGSLSAIQVLSAANTAVLFNLREKASGGILTLGNPANTPLTLDATGTDIGRIKGGGANPGLLVYGSNGASGTNGIFAVRNNATDDRESFRVTTATQTSSMVNATVSGKLVVGGGSPIDKILNGSGLLTFTPIQGQACQERPISMRGASTDNFGVFASPRSSLGSDNLFWSAWVSASGTISVRVCNPTNRDAIPAAVTWGFSVIQ
jgi:hypothetical protein